MLLIAAFLDLQILEMAVMAHSGILKCFYCPIDGDCFNWRSCSSVKCDTYSLTHVEFADAKKITHMDTIPASDHQIWIQRHNAAGK